MNLGEYSPRFTSPSANNCHMLETVLRARKYPFSFPFPLIREIRYNNRKKWLYYNPKNRFRLGRNILYLRCLSTVFSGPYQTFSFGRLANFPDSDRCEIYTRYCNWIEVLYDIFFRKIVISMATTNSQTRYQLNLNSTRIRFDIKKLTPVSKTMVYCTSNIQE